jgi:nucleotide-binding universal stress UspA family protein
MFKKILVPTDGSDLSDQAARAAIDFARAVQGEIVALSVTEPYPLRAPGDSGFEIDPGAEARQHMQHAKESVDKVAQSAATAGVPCTTATAVERAPHVAIIAAARDHQCDVIFMASHGRRGLSRLIAGSVTQNVLAYSAIPVLVFRPPRHQG